MVVGGIDNSDGTVIASVEIYDPEADTWTATGSLNVARAGHTATLLPNGRVFVTGNQATQDSGAEPCPLCQRE